MTALHTAGPWRLDGTRFIRVEMDDRWQVVAELHQPHREDGGYISTDEIVANGGVLSAAPELLAACKGLASYVYATTNPATAPSALRDAQAAIAKAEGREVIADA